MINGVLCNDNCPGGGKGPCTNTKQQVSKGIRSEIKYIGPKMGYGLIA